MSLSLEQFCQQKGIKLTSHRRVIAKVILDSEDHPDVEDIYIRSNKIDKRISLATVYRTLNLFESYGIIRKLELGGGKARYEIFNGEYCHHHLIDIKNGNIIEFFEPGLEVIKNSIAKKLGYKVLDYKFELYGIPNDKTEEE